MRNETLKEKFEELKDEIAEKFGERAFQEMIDEPTNSKSIRMFAIAMAIKKAKSEGRHRR